MSGGGCRVAGRVPGGRRVAGCRAPPLFHSLRSIAQPVQKARVARRGTSSPRGHDQARPHRDRHGQQRKVLLAKVLLARAQAEGLLPRPAPGYVHSGRLRTRRTARFLVSTYIFAGRERAGECTYPAGVYVTEKRVRNRSECTYPEARRGSARLGGQIEAKRQSAGRARRTCGQKCGDIVKGFDAAV